MSDCSGSSVNRFLKWSWWRLIVLPSCNWTLNDTGPELSMIWPGNHVSPLPWFLTNTFSPSENCHTLECLSWSNCCLLCFSATYCSKFGLSKSNLERRFLSNNISAGDRSVVVVVWFCTGTEILLFDHSEYPLMTCNILVWTLVQLFQPIYLRKADTVQLGYNEFRSIDKTLETRLQRTADHYPTQ